MSKKNKRGWTHQGVRDLNEIKGVKSVGIVLELPPDDNACQHQQTRISSDGYFIICKCGAVIAEI